jgi:hypothetical protein
MNLKELETKTLIDPFLNSLNYKNFTKDEIINKQESTIKNLINEVSKLSKENYDLRTINAMNINLENQLSKANEKIKNIENEKFINISKNNSIIREFQKKISFLTNENETNNKKFQKNMNVYNQKIENIRQIELENDVFKDEVKNLKLKNEKLKKETQEIIRNKEIKNQIKYSELKKKMIKNLNETKNNVTKLNIEYMNVSNKLTLLQNHQLIVQLEYQSQKMAEIEKINENLKIKILDLEKQIEIHKNVEFNMANKLKNYLNNNNSTDFKLNSNKILLNTNKSFSNFNFNNFNNESLIKYNENKFFQYEKEIKNKNNEIEKLKAKNSEIKNKLSLYEEKYSGLFNFINESLNKFISDKEIEKNKNIYINIEKIKKCDFTVFNNEEKYGLLILLLKYLMPLINLNFNNNCNIGNDIFETNLNVIHRKFNSTQNYLNDNILKRAFIGKNNKIKNDLIVNKSNFNFTNSIPMLKKSNNDFDPILKDKKYKACF